VLTPDGPLCAKETVSVVLPTSDGQMGILGGRAAVVARVGAGPLTLYKADESEHCFFIAGGFAQMRDDRLTILAEECLPIAKLNREAAWREIQEARRRPARTQEEYADRAEAVHVARVKFRLSQEGLGRGSKLKSRPRAGRRG